MELNEALELILDYKNQIENLSDNLESEKIIATSLRNDVSNLEKRIDGLQSNNMRLYLQLEQQDSTTENIVVSNEKIIDNIKEEKISWEDFISAW